jgi:hypothetical protein
MNPTLDALVAHAGAHPTDVHAQIAAAYALDREGREHEAVKYYDIAWTLGVPETERRNFTVGYGSTLRNVGRVSESRALLSAARDAEPAYAPYKIFLALALSSAGEHHIALATMMGALLDVARGGTIDHFERAIESYREELEAPR